MKANPAIAFLMGLFLLFGCAVDSLCAWGFIEH